MNTNNNPSKRIKRKNPLFNSIENFEIRNPELAKLNKRASTKTYMGRSNSRYQEPITINPGPTNYNNQKEEPTLKKSQSFNIKGTNDLVSKSKGRQTKELSSNLAFPGPTSYTNTIGLTKSISSADFVTGRERQILEKQFFRNKEEMLHPTPTD